MNQKRNNLKAEEESKLNESSVNEPPQAQIRLSVSYDPNIYRLVRIPKKNFDHEIKIEIQEETRKEMKEHFEIFAKDGKVLPKTLTRDLVSIGNIQLNLHLINEGFHKQSLQIKEIIDKRCFFFKEPIDLWTIQDIPKRYKVVCYK